MTKDEYGDFVLRYKGCGACFPLYHTLSRFEKMWFTAIQKDVEELEKGNEALKVQIDELKSNSGYIAYIERGHKIYELEKENAELKETVTKMNNVITETFSSLTKAKEIIKNLLDTAGKSWKVSAMDITLVYDAEQFLKEVEDDSKRVERCN